MKAENNTKEVLVESKNILFGEAKFLSFKIPEEWFVNPVPYRTDVESWNEIQGEKWVVNGYVQLCLVPGKNEKPLSLFIKVKSHDKKLKVGDWLVKKQRLIKGKRGERLEDAGFIYIHGHKAPYLAYTKLRKKFILFGEENKDFILEIVLKCDKTLRSLFLEVYSECPGYLDNTKSLNKLLSVFSTFTCH